MRTCAPVDPGALLAAAACMIWLTACGQKYDSNAADAAVATAPSPAAARPDIAADTAAAALTPKDRPNFRVCLSSSLDSEDRSPLAIPAGGDLRIVGSQEGRRTQSGSRPNMLGPDAIRYVVVLDRSLTLSKAAPCAETVAQAALSPIYDWRLPLVRESQDLQFQVADVENHMAFPLTDRLGDLVRQGLIFGYPTDDIGNARALKDED